MDIVLQAYCGQLRLTLVYGRRLAFLIVHQQPTELLEWASRRRSALGLIFLVILPLLGRCNTLGQAQSTSSSFCDHFMGREHTGLKLKRLQC